MKQFLLVCCVAAFSISSAWAGSEYIKESKQVTTPPCPSWYADNEWNISVWGAYAFTGNEYPTAANTFVTGAAIIGNPPGFDHDRYLNTDHAWGGGVDAKYFFKRYFGIGLEGFALNARQSYNDSFIDFFLEDSYERTSYSRELIGGVLATLTFRYPIGCSRFAPYVFVGGGAIFGGGQDSTFVFAPPPADGVITSRSGPKTKTIGQFGGGLEIRLTPHVGWINDFSWNVINRRENNFGMARTGINFAF